MDLELFRNLLLCLQSKRTHPILQRPGSIGRLLPVLLICLVVSLTARLRLAQIGIVYFVPLPTLAEEGHEGIGGDRVWTVDTVWSSAGYEDTG